MKKITLLVTLLCSLLGAATANAATISGTVNWGGLAAYPAVGHKVYLAYYNPAYRIVDSAIVNSSGTYSMTIPSFITSGTTVYIAHTDACTSGGLGFAYSGANITGANLAACGNMLQGYVVLRGVTDSTSAHLGAMVYVIRKAYDAVIGDTVLTAIDSVQTTGISYWGSGGVANAVAYYYSKQYATLPTGTLLIKAALLPTDTQYAHFLPTYLDSSLQWSGARLVGPTATGDVIGGSIYMQPGINPGGPGFIGGSVLLGANKGTAEGDPLASRIIMITNATTGKPVGYTYSDAAGHFRFSNLAYGTYKLFGDVWGKKNPALTVTISATNASVNNVLFKENRKDFTGQIGGLGVAGTNPLQARISAYPNPAKDYVEISGLAAIQGSKTITLSAMNGAVLYRAEFADGAQARIPVASLASGIYLLQVHTAGGMVQIKVAK